MLVWNTWIHLQVYGLWIYIHKMIWPHTSYITGKYQENRPVFFNARINILFQFLLVRFTPQPCFDTPYFHFRRVEKDERVRQRQRHYYIHLLVLELMKGKSLHKPQQAESLQLSLCNSVMRIHISCMTFQCSLISCFVRIVWNKSMASP